MTSEVPVNSLSFLGIRHLSSPPSIFCLIFREVIRSRTSLLPPLPSTKDKEFNGTFLCHPSVSSTWLFQRISTEKTHSG